MDSNFELFNQKLLNFCKEAMYENPDSILGPQLIGNGAVARCPVDFNLTMGDINSRNYAMSMFRSYGITSYAYIAPGDKFRLICFDPDLQIGISRPESECFCYYAEHITGESLVKTFEVIRVAGCVDLIDTDKQVEKTARIINPFLQGLLK